MTTTKVMRSEVMKGGPARAPTRSSLRARGMSDEDIRKPFVAVASTWNEATPCNVHLDRLADRVKEGVKSGGGTSREFVTIAVSGRRGRSQKAPPGFVRGAPPP